MPATVTLGSTTLAAAVMADDDRVKLVSVSDVRPGLCLYLQDAAGRGELTTVLSVADVFVKVIRGVGGTKASAHAPALTVWIGRPDQFFMTDPSGAPPDAVPVSPYINTKTGDVFFAQGDSVPVQGTTVVAARWWQKQDTTFDQGALGVRTATPDITAST